MAGRRIDWMYPLHVTPAVSRRRRLFSLLMALYLALDFVAPAMPGLLNFTIDFDRDAVRATASADIEEPTLALVGPPHGKAIQTESPSPRPDLACAVRHYVGEWLPMLRLSHHSRPASSDPDH